LFGDVEVEGHHALDLAAGPMNRQIGEVPVALFERAGVVPIETRPCLAPAHGLSGSINPLQQLDETLPAMLRNRFEQRLPDELAAADRFHGERVGELEDEVA